MCLTIINEESWDTLSVILNARALLVCFGDASAKSSMVQSILVDVILFLTERTKTSLDMDS